MPDVIDWLERQGQSPQWRPTDPQALAAQLRRAGVDEAMSAAVLAGDAESLQAQLGQRIYCCILMPGDGDEDGDDDGKHKKPPPKKKDKHPPGDGHPGHHGDGKDMDGDAEHLGGDSHEHGKDTRH